MITFYQIIFGESRKFHNKSIYNANIVDFGNVNLLEIFGFLKCYRKTSKEW